MDGMGLGLRLPTPPADDVDMNMQTEHPSTPTASPPVESTATVPPSSTTAAQEIESSPLPTATTSPRPPSSLHVPRLRCTPSTANTATASASPPTFPWRTTNSLEPPPATEATLPTSTSTADTTTRTSPPLRECEQPAESAQGFSSPAQSQGGNLHKRRVSTSPQKFNTGAFEPLTVRTDLQLPHLAPPAKRSRTKNKLEIDYDGSGTARFKETPAIVAAGFTPKTTAGYITSAVPSSATRPQSVTIPTPRMITTNSDHLLRWNTKRFKPKPFVKQKGFSLIEAFVKDNGLLMELVSYLTIPSLIDLYAISMTFHHAWNKHATAFIMASMRTWAPKADTYFPWRCYLSLCVKDPIKRQRGVVNLLPADADVDSLGEFSRDVPSLRWLQMVVWREGVVGDILIQLARRGLLLQQPTRDALKRMWFLLDLPLNAHRIALIRNTNYIPTPVLRLLMRFFVKLDMALTVPGKRKFPFNHPNQAKYPNAWAGSRPSPSALSEKLLAERTLTPLWRVLRNWSWDANTGTPPKPPTDLDMLKLLIRHKAYWDPLTTPYAVSSEKVLGMQLHDVPLVGAERFYRPQCDDSLSTKERLLAMLSSHSQKDRYFPRPLQRPDQLVIKELIRREAVPRGRDWNFYSLVQCGYFSKKGNRPVYLGEKALYRYARAMRKGKWVSATGIGREVAEEERREGEERKKREDEERKKRDEGWRKMREGWEMLLEQAKGEEGEAEDVQMGEAEKESSGNDVGEGERSSEMEIAEVTASASAEEAQ